MDWIEGLQKLVPWVSGLPILPKVVISIIVVAINILFLLLIWTPPVTKDPAKDPLVAEAFQRMARVLAPLAKQRDRRVTVDGVLVADHLQHYYQPYAEIAMYIRQHPNDIKGTYEQVWNYGGEGRVFIDDTQAFEAVVKNFFRTFDAAKKANTKAA